MPSPVLILFILVAGVLAFLFSPRFFNRPISRGRRLGLGLLQTLPLLMVCWLFLDPRALRSHHETISQTVVLLVDDSPSMGFEDGKTEKPRIAQAEEWADEVAKDWKASSRSEHLGLERLRLSDLLPPEKSGSDFAAALTGLVRRVPKDRLAGVVLVSDGRDRSSQSALAVAEDLGAPVDAVGIGPETAPEAIHARWLELPEKVMPGSPFLACWSVDASQASPRTVKAHISFASEELLVKDLSLPPPNAHFEDWISLTASHKGKLPLKISILSSEGRGKVLAESEAIVDADEEPLSVLVLEGFPSREVQSFSQALLKAGRYRILRPVSSPEGGGVLWDLSRPQETGEEESTLPWSGERMIRKNAEEWETLLSSLVPAPSLVALGQAPWDRMPSGWREDLTRHLASSRAGVLALPGSEKGFEMLPEGGLRTLLEWMSEWRASTTPVQLMASDQGRNHPAFAPVWSYLDKTWEIGPDTYFPQPPPFATVLLSDRMNHALAFEARLGLSHAIAMSLSNLWTLRSFSEASGGKDREAEFVEGLWLGIADYLSHFAGNKAAKVTLPATPPAVGHAMEWVVQDPALSPGPPVSGLELRREGEDWKTLLVTPDPERKGAGIAVWTPRRAGSYEIRYASSETVLRVQVSARPAEEGDRSLDSGFLKSLAAQTGGAYYPFLERDQVFSDFVGTPKTLTRTGRFPLRHDLWVGVALAVLFCTGWGLRRVLSLP
jgi:hypothetical protein